MPGPFFTSLVLAYQLALCAGGACGFGRYPFRVPGADQAARVLIVAIDVGVGIQPRATPVLRLRQAAGACRAARAYPSCVTSSGKTVEEDVAAGLRRRREREDARQGCAPWTSCWNSCAERSW